MPSIDDVRDFWDRRPCNIRHGTSPLGSIAYFDEVEARRYLVEPHILRFADFPRWAGKRVLEVGCGIGTDAISFARQGADVTVVELSERSLDVCRRRFGAFGLSAKFHLGSAEELGVVLGDAAPYDLVYSFGVLHHTPDVSRALSAIRRYVREDGGELRAMLYSKVSTKSLAIALSIAQPEAQAGCPIARTYTKSGVRSLLEGAGFRATSIEKDHIFPYDVARYVKHEYVKCFPWRGMPDAMFLLCRRLLGWHLLVRATPR